MERSNIFNTTIRDQPEEWTAGVWREVYDFLPGGGGMANRTDQYIEGMSWECRSWTTVVPYNSGKDPVESLERTRKGSRFGCNALVATGRRGRIPGYLAYRRRAKWNPVESAIRSPPTHRVQSDSDRCSSSKHQWERGKVSV